MCLVVAEGLVVLDFDLVFEFGWWWFLELLLICLCFRGDGCLGFAVCQLDVITLYWDEGCVWVCVYVCFFCM